MSKKVNSNSYLNVKLIFIENTEILDLICFDQENMKMLLSKKRYFGLDFLKLEISFDLKYAFHKRNTLAKTEIICP